MSQIPKTQKKLRGARFFLARMVEQERSLRLDKEDFDFYLSAFLSTARSVSWVLHAEQGDVYVNWHMQWEQTLTDGDRALLKFMNEQRIAEVKQRGAEVKPEVESVPVTKVEWNDQRHPAYGISWWGPPGTPPPEVGQMVHYFEIDGTRERATETCKRYLELLEKLIRDFEQAGRALA